MNQNASDISILDNKPGRAYTTNGFFKLFLEVTGIYCIRNYKNITNLSRIHHFTVTLT